jgi:hypothetical protein
MNDARATNATITQFSGGTKAGPGFGTVFSIILDETHPRIKESTTGETIELIGAIEFRYSNSKYSNDKPSIAYPADKNFKNLPVRNETVEILQGDIGQILYRRIGTETSPNVSANPKEISTRFKPDQQNQGSKQENYGEVKETGIVKSNVDDNSKFDGFGKYFNSEKGIHKLKLYEGDMLIESRFGQSIRFSGYNNSENKFAPTIIIRNSENAITRKKDIKSSIDEDITRDGGIITLSSGDNQLAFIPGTVDDGGSSDFSTKPNSFKDYPSKLSGDQILINSGRILLSSRNAEMIFYSKKNYGFISDGAMSIDNKMGITANVGDNINVTTNDRDINLNTGNGKINAGNKDLEPMVKGQKLVDLLGELIDAISLQNYLTPAGPSKVGPENKPTFDSIKSKLKTILSELNKTA